MGKLEEILYHDLEEDSDENVKGWAKQTVEYVASHKTKIEKKIRSLAVGRRKRYLQHADIEDIYDEVLFYLYKYDDYNINKAIDRSSTGSIVSLEAYINMCVKFCVIRYCAKLSECESNTVSEMTIGEDEKELSIFDTLADPKADISLDCIDYDLSSLCKSIEPIRYRFGPDIYQIIYVRLLTSTDNSGTIFRNTLDILGVSKNDVSQIDRSSEDSVIVALAKAISNSGYDESSRIIEKYVYSADKIKEVVQNQFIIA